MKTMMPFLSVFLLVMLFASPAKTQTTQVATVPVITDNKTSGTYMAANSSRAEVYVANPTSLLVIDTNTWKVKGSYALTIPPMAICLSPATGEVATLHMEIVNGTATSTLMLTNPETGTPRSVKNPGGLSMAASSCGFAPDGSIIYLGNANYGPGIVVHNKIVAINTTTWQVVKTWSTTPLEKLPVTQLLYHDGNVYAITNYQLDVIQGKVWFCGETSAYCTKVDIEDAQAMSMSLAPNGLLYVNGAVRPGNFWIGKEETIDIASAKNLRVNSTGEISPTYSVWGNYPWLAHVMWSKGFGSLVLPSGDYLFDTGGVDPDISNYGIVGWGNSDGSSDTVVLLRDQCLAVFKITLPALVVFNTGNAAATPFESSAKQSLVQVNGHGFNNATTFQVDYRTVPLVMIANQRQAYVQVPETTFAGRHNFTAVNQDGTTSTTRLLVTVDQNLKLFPAYNGKPLMINSQGYPALTARGGEQITLLGTGGGTTLTSFSATNPFTQYPLATIPAATIDGLAINLDYVGKWGYPFIDAVRFTLPSGIASGTHDLVVGTTTYKGGIVVE